MGCTFNRSPNEVEEKLICSAEKSLSFHKKSCKEVTQRMHRYCTSFHLSKQQLDQTLKELSISQKHLSFFQLFLENHEDCYFKFWLPEKTQDCGYSVKRLAVLGILLSNGKVSEKANCLFDLYDIDASKTLDQQELNIMATDLLLVSLEYLPKLSEMVEQTQSPYNQKLFKMHNTLVEYFEFVLLGEETSLNLDKFIEKFQDPEVRVLLSTSETRKFAYQKYNEALNSDIDDSECNSLPLKNKKRINKKRKSRKIKLRERKSLKV